MQEETFARKMILLSGKAKTHAEREFTEVNERMSTFLTLNEGKRAFVRRSLKI